MNPKRWDQSISLGDNIMLLRLWSQMRAEGRVLAWGGVQGVLMKNIWGVKAIREDVPLLITALHRVKQNNRDQGHRSRPQEGLLISLTHTHVCSSLSVRPQMLVGEGLCKSGQSFNNPLRPELPYCRPDLHKISRQSRSCTFCLSLLLFLSHCSVYVFVQVSLSFPSLSFSLPLVLNSVTSFFSFRSLSRS